MSPAKISNAPAHHKVDVALPFCVEDETALRARDLKLGSFVAPQEMFARFLHIIASLLTFLPSMLNLVSDLATGD